MHPSVKYSRLSTSLDDENGALMTESKPDDPAFSFDSVFTYNKDPESGYKNDTNFNSAFQYKTPEVSIKMGYDENALISSTQDTSILLTFTSWMLTFLSYLFFIMTFPVSYWFLVKKMGEFDRMVVFRLGKMIGVKGPGRFVVFPWIDRTKQIDVRAAAFAVPPQQFITSDGGIVELGAEIQYGIMDAITMVSEVADHQNILRSLGRTLLVKILSKKCVHQLEKDKRISEDEIMDELNDQVRKWGINVSLVALSETKVLKQAENTSSSALGAILKGLGMKDDAKYPTPEEFVRSTQGVSEQPGTTVMDKSSTLSSLVAPGSASINMSLLQSLSRGTVFNNSGLDCSAAPQTSSTDLTSKWGRCLEIILEAADLGVIDEESQGLFKLEITETESGKDVYYINLTTKEKTVNPENLTGRKPDVYVTIPSSDLASVLDGSLAPLQAYLTGRISASGDVKKVMNFMQNIKKAPKGSVKQV